MDPAVPLLPTSDVRRIRHPSGGPPYGARPPSGTGLIVTGSIFTAIGGVNLLTAPICKTDLIAKDTQTVCLGASLGVGIGFVAIGIPMLLVGVNTLGWHGTF